MSDTDYEENNKKGGFWFGLTIGGLVGAVASYFALTDDKQRKKLLKKGKVILDGLEDFGEDVKDKGEEIRDQVVEKVEEVSEAVEEKRPQVAKATKKAVKEVKTIAGDAIERVEEAVSDAGDTAKQLKKSAFKSFFFKKGKPLVKKKK